MLLTAEEATTKWCPQARVAGYLNGNRVGHDPSGWTRPNCRQSGQVPGEPREGRPPTSSASPAPEVAASTWSRWRRAPPDLTIRPRRVGLPRSAPGATIGALMTATGWLEHTTRVALTS